MEELVEGRHVRLRHADLGMYLYADEDGVGLCLSQRRASLNTAWLVHRVPATDHRTFFRLSGAAYGLYLANSPQLVADGPDRYLLGQRRLRIFHGEPDRDEAVWEAIKMENAVFMNHAMYTYVSDFEIREQNAGMLIMNMRWFIEVIPLRQQPPELPPSDQVAAAGRSIMYVLADDDGRVDMLRGDWRSMNFFAFSVFDLKTTLASHLGLNFFAFTMCIWHGFGGGLTPLVVDLPLNQDHMDIVILTNEATSALELRHPDVHADG